MKMTYQRGRGREVEPEIYERAVSGARLAIIGGVIAVLALTIRGVAMAGAALIQRGGCDE
ncbi:MAG: hypothetical protein ACTHW1_01620 [Ancrocorticia sp.]|uniref:hypothetical protein n=1 Tax=Ancrocorticia sp. TaxID=2593684 RepID=UPI003F9321E1